MGPLKIALFSDSALPVLNGVSVSIDALMKALRQRGHSVFLFTSRYPGHTELDPNVTRFISVPFPWFPDYPLAVPPFYPWFQEFKKQNFDIVHTHTPFTVGFVGLRWAQSCEVPLVTTYHTHYDKYQHYVPFFPKPYLRYKVAKHTNFYYNSVDHVITPSETSKKWLARHSVHKPITVIPTGIPDPEPVDRAKVRRDLGIDESRKVVLYTGRLAMEKNLRTLLTSASIVLDREPNAELWLVGDGPAHNDAKSFARELGIGDRAKFWGFIPRREVSRYYAASDVFLFCSQTETQGLVVTEAMAYGLPAVVVQGGGASGSVNNGLDGFVVSNDPAEIAGKVLDLLATPELYTHMSRHAIQTAQSSTVSVMAERVLQVYLSTLQRESLTNEAYVS